MSTGVSAAQALAEAGVEPPPETTSPFDPSTTRAKLLLSFLIGGGLGVALAYGILKGRPDVLAETRAELASRSSAERAVLSDNLSRLESHSDRAKLIALAESIRADETDALMRTAAVYRVWHASQPPEVQTALRELEGREKLDRVRELIDAEEEAAATSEEFVLRGEDAESLARRLASHAGLSDSEADQLADASIFLLLLKSIDQLRLRGLEQFDTAGEADGRPSPFDSLRDNANARALASGLRPIAGELLDAAPPGALPQRLRDFRRFIAGQNGEFFGGRQVSPEALDSFFATALVLGTAMDSARQAARERSVPPEELRRTLEEMTLAERGELMSASPDEFRRQLVFRYVKENVFDPAKVTLPYSELQDMVAAVERGVNFFRSRIEPGGRGGANRFGPPREGTRPTPPFRGGTDRGRPRDEGPRRPNEGSERPGGFRPGEGTPPRPGERPGPR